MATKKKMIRMAPKAGFQSLRDIVNPSVATQMNEPDGVGEGPAAPAAAQPAAAPAPTASTAAERAAAAPASAATVSSPSLEQAEAAGRELQAQDATVQASGPLEEVEGDITPWQLFAEYADAYYRDTDKTRGVTVWIDDDVKDVLDKIKASGEVRVPIRHMVSAMCRIFIEQNKDDIIRAITKSKRKNSLL